MADSMEYRRYDPSGCAFPRPRVPVLPPLDRRIATGMAPAPAAELAPDRRRDYAFGRYALHAAYRLAGLAPGGVLLAPAFHCRTMLDPALALGAGVRLYPVNEDLTPRLDVIEELLRDTPARVLLVTHYFGHAQPPELQARLAALCEARGVALVEDCAHALRSGASRRIGHVGRYGISSPYKFHPSADGGLLWSNADALPPESLPRSRGIAAELKAWVAFARGRHAAPQLYPGPLPELPVAADDGRDLLEHGDAPSTQYRPELQGRASLAAARHLIGRSDVHAIAAARRRRYAQWVQAVAGLPHCRALLPDWHEDDAPYMFPLLIDDPERHFARLKRLGMPIWRWDDMAVSGCAVSARYRLQLLQLPCHQGIADPQMNWMVATLSDVLESAPRAVEAAR